MAVEKVKISEFFNVVKNRTILTFVVLQFLSILIVGILSWYLINIAKTPADSVFWISFGLLIACNFVICYEVFIKLSDPLRILSQAIAHVSKEAIVTPPPDTNNPKYELSGIRDMVKVVYELAANLSPNTQLNAPTRLEATLFKHLLDNLPCGVIAISNENKIIYSNYQAPIDTNSDGQSVIRLLFQKDDNLNTWLNDARANKVQDLHNWTRISDNLTSEENVRIFDVSGYYQKGHASGVDAILVAFDRTSIYAMDQDGLDFIALAAHELRGPVTVIRGYIDVLQQELVNKQLNQEDMAVLLERLQVSAEQLSGYINNVLSASLFGRTQPKLHLQEESMLDILKPLVPELTLRAKAQNRILHFNIEPSLPTVAVERSAIAEVITNLVDNAIKYSHQGGEINVTSILKGDFIETTVQDSGIGIPESIVSNLFSKFYRSHRSKQSVTGSGLGLYICKTIVEANGGKIWVRSVEGKGSTFGFQIPTYASIADKIGKDNNSNDIARRSEGWIKNHALYRG